MVISNLPKIFSYQKLLNKLAWWLPDLNILVLVKRTILQYLILFWNILSIFIKPNHIEYWNPHLDAQGLPSLLNGRTLIGIKRMGEIDPIPFVSACEQRYPTEAMDKSAELCSLWQENIKDPEWHPFKVLQLGADKCEVWYQGCFCFLLVLKLCFVMRPCTLLHMVYNVQNHVNLNWVSRTFETRMLAWIDEKV